ncbi:MAG: hypothetical protein AB7M05_03120 [Alphaproteobacteria bacterium]
MSMVSGDIFQSAPNKPPLIAVFLSSKKQEQLVALFRNLDETIADPRRVEVLVKIDVEAPRLSEWLAAEAPRHTYRIRWAVGPRWDGYWSLHKGYALLQELVNPRTYFLHLINDEVRYKTQGWDAVLEKYVGFFPDDIFHLRVSRHKLYNYMRFYKAIEQPENYPVMTRRWVEISEGWGEFRGPDTWHGGINWFLSMRYGHFRSIQIHDVELDLPNEAAELSAEQLAVLGKRNLDDYAKMSNKKGQENFARLAAKLHCAILAHEWGLTNISFKFDEVQRCAVMHANGVPRYAPRYRITWLSYLSERIFSHLLLPVLMKNDRRAPWYFRWFPGLTLWSDRFVRRIAKASNWVSRVLYIAFNVLKRNVPGFDALVRRCGRLKTNLRFRIYHRFYT